MKMPNLKNILLDKTKDDNFSENQKRNLVVVNIIDSIQVQLNGSTLTGTTYIRMYFK